MIQQRRWMDAYDRRRQLSWQTRTLSQFIAATVPVQPNSKASPLLDLAMTVSIDPDEQRHLSEAGPTAGGATDRASGGRRENAPGSYERLMRGFRVTPPPAS